MASRGKKILELLKTKKQEISTVINNVSTDNVNTSHTPNLSSVNVNEQLLILLPINANVENEEAEPDEPMSYTKLETAISFEAVRLPGTSGSNKLLLNSSTGKFECSSGEEYSSGEEFCPDAGAENMSSSSGSEDEYEESIHYQEEERATAGQNSEEIEKEINLEVNGDKENSNSNKGINVVNAENIECDMPKKKLKVYTFKEKICKKRVKNESEWKKKKQALAREKGENYISYKGKKMPCKIIDDNLCGETCRLKCNQKFSSNDKKRILSDFYQLDVNAKNALLFKSIVTLPVVRKRKNAKTHKSSSYKYNVTVNNDEKVVCKTAFCKLFQISRGKIDVVKQKIKSGSSAPSPDLRGRHSNRPHKLIEHVVEAIVKHIKKFPAESSHYSRNCNQYKQYLSPCLNMSIMYRLYLEEYRSEKRPDEFLVKRSSYVNIFNTKFNLSFSQPKTDTCSVCDSGNSNTEHKENASIAFECQKLDRELARNNTNFVYLTMDLQQTMPLPKITTSKAFYLRQLWFYNFGIHFVTTNGEKSFMQTWTEDIAGRSSSEIASCLYNFINTCNELENKEHLIIWSDSCSGQNKNFNIVCLYQLMIYQKKFKCIDHKFPEVGHSYLDSDRDFGRIEKVLRRHEKILTPQQYRDHIRSALKSNGQVNDMKHYFRKIDDLSGQLGLMQKKKNLLNETVPFRSIKWIRVDEFGTYLYKQTYDEYTPFKKVCLLKNTKSRTNPNCELIRASPKQGKISKEKLDNLRTQLQFVDEEHRWFYEEILSQCSESEEEPQSKKKKKKTN